MNGNRPGLGNPAGPRTSTTAADIADPSARRRWFITNRWGIACEDRMCVNCTCGQSLELEEEEADGGDYDLTA